jgi:membrane protein
MNRQDFVAIIRETLQKWQSHDAFLRAGALTFFDIMPLPSLLLIVVAIFAQIYGQEQALQQLIHQVTVVAGPAVADLVSQLLKSAQSPFTSIFGSFFSIVFAVAGAIGAFSVLQNSINVIWEIKPEERGLSSNVRSKVGQFLLITAVGLIVIAWTGFSTVFFSAAVFVLEPVLGGFASIFLRTAHIVLSFALGTLLFAIIFKQLPDTAIEWRDVALAAVITSFVFTVLNYLFGIYLSAFPITTLAGAAGSLMLLLLWIYLTNQFILFGAQFSKTYAETNGSISKRVGPRKPEKQIERLDVTMNLELKFESDEQHSQN